MSTLLQDLKFSLRLLAKSPGFTAVAILTLALAIGVNSAIFSLVNGLVLKSPVPEKPHEIVGVFTLRKDASRDYRQFSYAEFMALREKNDLFTDVAAINFSLAGIGQGDAIRRSFVFMVSDNFFATLGARPAAGRFFTPEEGRANANLPVVVASYQLWERHGRQPDFVGSTLYVNGRPHTVVGVTPKGFSGVSALIAPEIWLPLGTFSNLASAFGEAREVNDLTSPKNYTLNLLGRLQPGLTVDTAQPRLSPLIDRLTAVQADPAAGPRDLQVVVPSRFSLSTTPEDDGPLPILATLLLGMAGVVLLIACLNLANMLLARGTARAREMAVRLAVGATRGQIVRQLFVEGLVLAVAGGTAGVTLAYWTNHLLENSFTTLLGSMNFVLSAQLQPDTTALAVTFLFCLVATLLFSLGPALKAARTDVVTDLKASGGDTATTGRWNRFFAGRHLLVMAQMTLSLVLLFSAGLFLRAALKAGGLNPGFRPDGVVVSELDFSLANTPRAESSRRMFAALDRLRATPGVTAAGLTTLLPYGSVTNTRRIIAADAPVTQESADPKAPRPGQSGIYSGITPGYLASIGVKILRGRDFTETEARQQGTVRVAIIDEGMAAKLFPGKDALGQRVRYTQTPTDGLPNEMEIVGIVNRHRHDVSDDHDGGARCRLYVPLAQEFSAAVNLTTRLVNGNTAATLAAVPTLRRELRALDPELPLLRLTPFTMLMEKSITLWIIRLGAVMFGVFGGIALLLAVIGVYGVKAYAVERRTREIGIRMALGADRGDVFGLIMRQGGGQIAFSVVLGGILSLLVGRILASVLFQVSPADPLVLGAAAGLLALAALLACYIPARRATRVSPLTALRAE
ncbi:MAG: ABC transporter permease [Opitutaceae bacterium]|nr:ABC transporter permease [Opitutaceae bacterium]